MIDSKVDITQHAIERWCERFPTLGKNCETLREAFKSSTYISIKWKSRLKQFLCLKVAKKNVTKYMAKSVYWTNDKIEAIFVLVPRPNCINRFILITCFTYQQIKDGVELYHGSLSQKEKAKNSREYNKENRIKELEKKLREPVKTEIKILKPIEIWKDEHAPEVPKLTGRQKAEKRKWIEKFNIEQEFEWNKFFNREADKPTLLLEYFPQEKI